LRIIAERSHMHSIIREHRPPGVKPAPGCRLRDAASETRAREGRSDRQGIEVVH
jgi:hypothetical protein